MKKLEESYNWIKIPDNLPRENLVLVKAKTTKTTLHPDDKEYPSRIFLPDELKEAARSLAQRPIGINHTSLINGAFVVDANWDDTDKCIEALLFIPDYFMKKIKEGIINKVSVEYTWRSEENTKEGTIFHGFVFNRVDLLEKLNAGDSNTEIRPVLMESMKALMEGIIETTGETDIKQLLIQDSVDSDIDKECEGIMKTLGEPLHKDYQKIKDKMVSQYGDKKGTQVYYAWLNKKGLDDTKAYPSKKEASVISIIPDVELKEKNLSGKQIPEQTNPMATQPTPLTAIHSPIPQPMNPKDKITSIGAIADNKGPITFESKEGDKLDKSMPIGGEPILNVIKDLIGAKQGIESASIEKPKEELKKEEVKPTETKKEEVKPIETSKPVEEKKLETPKVEEKPKEVVKVVEVPKIDDKDVKIVELQESIKKLQENAKKTDEQIAKAKKEAKLEVIKKVEETLPSGNIVSNFNLGGRRLADEIRKTIYDTKRECE